jgi:MPBQ/MSBQ methyltransferase
LIDLTNITGGHLVSGTLADFEGSSAPHFLLHSVGMENAKSEVGDSGCIQDHRECIVRYYTEAGPDYRTWSKRYNMHFGMFRWGMNPFHLEAMLERMNEEVLALLELDPARPQRVLDMGCGLGGTARYAAARYSNLQVSGVTIVPWQASQATKLETPRDDGGRVAIVAGNYMATPFSDASFDGVYALESSCYAPGYSKEPLLREMYRVLKPGGRFAVADAFLKTMRKMSPITRHCYRTLCDCWALKEWGEIHAFVRCAEEIGFAPVQAKNISRNVTPSVLHAIPTMLRLLLKQASPRSSRMTPHRWDNMMAGFWLLLFALDRTRSGYFTVTGIKH